MPPGPMLVAGCCGRWMVLEDGSFLLGSDSRSSLAYWPAAVIQEIFFVGQGISRGLSDSGMFCSRWGFVHLPRLGPSLPRPA